MMYFSYKNKANISLTTRGVLNRYIFIVSQGKKGIHANDSCMNLTPIPIAFHVEGKGHKSNMDEQG